MRSFFALSALYASSIQTDKLQPYRHFVSTLSPRSAVLSEFVVDIGSECYLSILRLQLRSINAELCLIVESNLATLKSLVIIHLNTYQLTNCD